MRQDLHRESVAVLESDLGVLADAHARGGARDDDGAGLQRGALREEADQLGDIEDEVTVFATYVR